MNTFRLLALSLLLIAAPISADVMVMVHGYHGNPDDWRSSGIVPKLSAAGWQDGGAVFFAPDGQLMMPSSMASSSKLLLTVHLPSEYPLILQSQTLEKYLQAINSAYPEERLILVGHSAGGVRSSQRSGSCFRAFAGCSADHHSCPPSWYITGGSRRFCCAQSAGNGGADDGGGNTQPFGAALPRSSAGRTRYFAVCA